MHFFAPERPEASPTIKAWLLDGSALPVVTIRVKDPDTVQLLIMLRNYTAGSNFTYSYSYLDLRPAELNTFFASYIDDPEGTIERHTGWKPQRATKSWNPNDFKKSLAVKAKPEPSAEDKALLDLL